MTAPLSPFSQDALWTRRFWLVLLGVFVFRVLFMLFFVQQSDLVGDEAYYWDWGRQLDWGYFSKPPMIGWLMGLVGRLTNNAEWGVRLAPLVMGTATTATLFLLARRLYDARTAFLACALILLTPGNAGLNLLFTIDAPLLLTWSLALLLFWYATEKPACWVRWSALAVVMGLGVLSKQMMLIFPLLMVLFAAFSPPDRPLLKNPRLWIASVVGMAFLTPVLLWNQKHQWITLEHTKHHFDAGSVGFGKWLSRTLEFPGLQALVYSPVTFVALFVVLWVVFKKWKQLGRRERFLWLFSAPALIGFLALSLRQRINPNWPAVFYVPAFILAAAWMDGRMTDAARTGWKKWSLRIGAAFVILAHVGIPIVFLTELKTNKKLGDMRGWRETGEQAGTFLPKVPRPDHTFVLALGYRYNAALFGFYMPQHPQCFRWEPSGKTMSQYEVWPGPETRLGDDALILNPRLDAISAVPPEVAECFEKIELMGTIEVPLGKTTRIFDVLIGHKLLRWQAIGAHKKESL